MKPFFCRPVSKILLSRDIQDTYQPMQNVAGKYFPRHHFLIQNKYTGLAMELYRKESQDGSPIRGVEPYEQNIYQLWMFEQAQPGLFEIINCATCFAISDDTPNAVLHFPRQKSSQLWKLKQCTVQSNSVYYWFLRSNSDEKALKLDGDLTCSDFDLNNEHMVFKMVPVTNNLEVNSSVFIRSGLSGRVLDVPGASTQKGEAIIQYRQNYRFNQRWKLVKVENGFMIQNVRSKLYLDISGESREPGAKIIQWICSPSGLHPKLNQVWSLQNKQANVYLIRSVMDPSLILSVQNLSIHDEAKVVTANYKSNYLWAIQ